MQALMIALAVGLAVGNLTGGGAVRWYYRAEIASAEVRALKLDNKAAAELADSAGKTAAEISAAELHNNEVTRETLRTLAARPACVLGADDVRRLRALR